MVGMGEVGLSGGSEVIMTVPLKEIFGTLTSACLSLCFLASVNQDGLLCPTFQHKPKATLTNDFV